MDLKIDNKVFLVSGGASGIGEAISLLLSKEKAIPVILDRNNDKIEAITGKIKDQGMALQVDLSSAANCEKAVAQTIEQLGRIDGVVNNAGLNDSVGLENGSPEAFLHSFRSNLSHYYDLVHYALPYMKKQGGSILNISSKTALTGQGGTSGYAAAKGAQLALTREWAVELLKYNIRVNAIVPAEVMTPMYKNWISTFDDPDAKLKGINRNIPLENRMTTPEEIANLAVFALSGKASHITGQYLFSDGGYVHLDRALSVLNR